MSNNRRRLLEDNDSFRKSGIPCGNPRRYGCQDVVRMDPVTCLGKRKLIGQDDDIETQGEKQLQEMAKKQLNTNITLKEQVSQHRTFASSGQYKPAIKTLSGVAKLENYREVLQKDSAVAELRRCGLTDDEINLKLGNTDNERKHHYGVHPHANSQKLEEINRRINERGKSDDLHITDNQLGVREMGRRELEIEHRLTGGNSQVRALSDFLTRQKVMTGDLEDPLNKLPELLEDIKRKGREKKRKPKSHCFISTEQLDSIDTEFIGPLLPGEERINSREPVTGPNPVVEESREGDVVCQFDAEGRRVVMETVEEVPEDVIKKYRLKLVDIRALPRFENYSPGEPNKTLFLKNLSNKVTEEDLVSLFGRFQNRQIEKIVYRLMSGRMRGQAFVTFQDAETASEALELINGYHFRGKPIIIQYGKRSTGSMT